jgi:hypothetical protein
MSARGTTQHARPYVDGTEGRIVATRLACWGHHPIVNEDHERCLVCGRELDQHAVATAYRVALMDQSTLGFKARTWLRSEAKRAAA